MAPALQLNPPSDCSVLRRRLDGPIASRIYATKPGRRAEAHGLSGVSRPARSGWSPVKQNGQRQGESKSFYEKSSINWKLLRGEPEDPATGPGR
ncbi:hypothetical protein IscW_ISCW003501 [Ixodes scapularis]|uniref:Uncharacterized protein n=1 Tax=Ixodes scapularis TaxID=6945 RepID=B7PG45_IXOSC|nr:hypothetical protein IscW_ISCW003501 [Ixodes scapularis]|eukprot:XP_002434167.1 hypothetical protein IscW_ISCW003501 [Ixodes scapularis]